MTTQTIRDVRSGDAPEIAAIYAPIVESTTISFEESAPDAAEIARRIAYVTVAYPWLVAEDAGRILGYAYGGRLRERECYRFSVETTVYVAEHARGRGIGLAVYSQLLERLSASGFHRAFAGVALPNDASVALHRQCGFEHIGVYKEIGFKFGRWIDVSWWQRALAM